MQIRITVPGEVVDSAAKARLREELLAGWNHYHQSGLHLTGDEVDAWLEQLALDPSTKPPALHR